ncbi:uncharacterized protein FIBRA_05895 [Fibroporia radiculosa]|uniref:Aldehyde dehydrogenase domain-containing protein n=1 Tax=Fibroporia radiculosa TaxID=599839 RepID=J4H3S4_9APHY|nr:uncharacterized protein FIBRA_05895 [Fibroporia radiculosa]CCM03749.1 predicted protein [Fibroporia radiculosa]
MAYSGDDDGGFDVFWLLTIFFALGIWLVINRFQTVHNRAVPFRWPAPKPVGPQFEAHKIPNPSLESHLLFEEIRPSMYMPERRYITCFDPATSFHLDCVLADTSLETTAKIYRAAEAQKRWKNTSFRDRRRVVRSLKKWLVDNQETCAKVACRDTGKTMLDAALGEVLTTCAKMDWLINHGERYLRPESRRSSLLMFYKKSYVCYEPLGVVAAIVSWNYPLHNAWSPILSALFAGNAVVLKCSEHVAWSTDWFVGAIKQCLEVSGHDPELVQLVRCYPDEVEALTKSPLIKHITFIGSEEVGRKVAIAATEHLIPVTLELGGKDPAIVMPDTDLKQWISIWMRGIYQNAGQNCIGIERLLVHSSQYDELHAMLVARVKDLRVGSTLSNPNDGFVSTADVGAMISPERVEATELLVRVAKDSGLDVVGGTRYEHPYMEYGSYFHPTLVSPVHPESDIAQRELFAPVALLMKYDTLEEAVAIANGTRYGLGASVFGPKQEQCVNLARQLECGMVSINDFGVFYPLYSQDLPFGGTKSSGYGRFGGPEGLRSLTNPKAIVVDRFAWAVQTTIPKPVDYPIPSIGRSWDFISGLVGQSSSCSASAPTSCQNTTVETDSCCFEGNGLLQQVQFWDTNPSTGPSDSWTIHGLWPNSCDGSYSEYCDYSTEYKDITTLLQDQGASDTLDYMQTYWISDDESNEDFWEHEWAAHGTCYTTLASSCFSDSTTGANAVAFFENVVTLFQTLPTYSWLEQGGITPTNDRTFTLDELQSAIQQASGVTASFDCDDDNTLYQIEYWFNLQGPLENGDFIAIDAYEAGSCSSEGIAYPPKSSSD